MGIDWFCKVFSKKFIPIKKLGSGSFASVWMSYDLDDNKYVALKLYFSKEYKNGELESKIFKELYKNNTHHVLKYNGSYVHKEKTKKYYANSFELMLGCTQILMKMDTFSTYGMPYEHTIKLFKQLVEGVVYMHENGYLHGDIKPENVLIHGLSVECRDIIEKLKLAEFAKKRKRSGVAEQIVEYVKKNIKHENSLSDDDSDSESEYCESDSESSEYEDVNPQIDDEDDKISLISNDDIKEKKSDKIIELTIDQEQMKKEYSFLLEKCLNLKLGDMGSAKKINSIDYNKKHIQTSYYRPPEIILRTYYNEKIDIWSLGCMLYEYLTGDILFDADEYEKIHFTRYHLFLINEAVGTIPLEITNASLNKDILFYCGTHYVKSSHVFNIENNIVNKLKTKLKNKNLSDDKMNDLIDAMLKMLECDYNKRISAKELLNHNIFK